MRTYFALPAVRAGDVSEEVAARFGADSRVYPCCVTLPMGWSHSVLVAQLAHEHLLDTRTALRPADRITHHIDPNVDSLRHQVYIDDLTSYTLTQPLCSALRLTTYKLWSRSGG